MFALSGRICVSHTHCRFYIHRMFATVFATMRSFQEGKCLVRHSILNRHMCVQWRLIRDIRNNLLLSRDRVFGAFLLHRYICTMSLHILEDLPFHILAITDVRSCFG